MRYEMMFPYQIRKAIKENWPVIFPIGVLEYHGEHTVLGLDTLVITKALEILEKEFDFIILPTFFYGSASYVVEPPEQNGSIHIDSNVLHLFAQQLFRSLLRVGFRNIHCLIWHQTENFIAGMPTDLAFKLAARQVLFEYLEAERGEGWWGDNSMKNYYIDHEKGKNPFNWIQIHPLLNIQEHPEISIDHAGKMETSLMLAFSEDCVQMDKISENKWYSETAKHADIEHGNIVKEAILNNVRTLLKENSQ
jgi:creatinine amidohydrolase/Fe(II)-dependent formamide hydrolase-like protein